MYQNFDSIDAFRRYSPNSHYSGVAMASGQHQQPSYGAPGSFSGRKAMQPPGGFSSISIGDGSNHSPYSRYGVYQGGGAGSILAQSPTAYSPQGSYMQYPGQAPGTDLSSQLNLSPAGRRPPSAGRRADAYASYPSQSASYGMQYGSAASQQPYSVSSQQPYNVASAYPGSPAQSAGYYSAQGGASYSPQAAYSPQTAYSPSRAQPAYTQQAAYGNAYSPSASSAAAAAAGYGQQSAYGAGYGSSSPASNAAYSQYGAPSPTVRIPDTSYGAAPAVCNSPSFVPGQKGQFCGKIIQQPPGGRTSLNIFG